MANRAKITPAMQYFQLKKEISKKNWIIVCMKIFIPHIKAKR